MQKSYNAELDRKVWEKAGLLNFVKIDADLKFALQLTIGVGLGLLAGIVTFFFYKG